MKLYINEGNILKIDEETKLEILNIEDFVSTINKESNFVPARHIIVSLKYKLIHNNFEYVGESTFNSYTGITDNINDNSPYKVELFNWNLSNEKEKYLEFNIINKKDEFPKYTYGTFVNLDNKDEIEIYKINVENKNEYSEIQNEISQKAKISSFNWIINNKQFKIKKALYTYSTPGYHDEEGSENTIEKQDNFEFDALASILFECEKDSHKFKLKPTINIVKIHDNKYIIPLIQIYDYLPEKIGLEKK